MQKAEVAKSLSQDGTLAYTSDPNIANFDDESIAQNKLKCQIFCAFFDLLFATGFALSPKNFSFL